MHVVVPAVSIHFLLINAHGLVSAIYAMYFSEDFMPEDSCSENWEMKLQLVFHLYFKSMEGRDYRVFFLLINVRCTCNIFLQVYCNFSFSQNTKRYNLHAVTKRNFITSIFLKPYCNISLYLPILLLYIYIITVNFLHHISSSYPVIFFEWKECCLISCFWLVFTSMLTIYRYVTWDPPPVG